MLRGEVRCHQIQNDRGKLPAVGIGVAVYLPGIGTPSWRLFPQPYQGRATFGKGKIPELPFQVFRRAQMGQLN
jgi:hypothetical protein